MNLRKLRIFARAFSMLGAHKVPVLIGCLCVPASVALSLWIPHVVGAAIEQIRRIGAHEADEASAVSALVTSCLFFAGLALADGFVKFVARSNLIVASRRVEEQLKNELVGHIARLPAQWYDKARTGDLISRLTQDVELVRFVVGPAVLHGGIALLTVPLGLWLMAQISVTLMLVTIASFTLLLISMLTVMPRLEKHSKAAQEAISAISQRSQEAFAGIRVLISFARGTDEVTRMRTLSRDYLGCNLRLVRLRALMDLLVQVFRNLVVLGALVLGARAAIRGEITLGGLFEFLLLLGAMVWPLISIGWILAAFHRAIAAAERIEEIFAIAPEAQTGITKDLQGEIEVRNLTFTYAGQMQPALRGVSFQLHPGQKLGLVGPVGSGKSTLLLLLLRLYEPPPGTIFVDGVDILALHPRTLRDHFALAPQDPFLFSDTIAGNVAFGNAGNLDAVPEFLHAAVADAALDSDLTAIQGGLEALVGERGITLSGGQKQRTSLARALASGRRALILDDTLSAVDVATERRILARLERHRGRTTLIAAHRLSAVRDADLILVLERGEVTARGTHEELLKADGYYSDTWRRQQEEHALEGEAEEIA